MKKVLLLFAMFLPFSAIAQEIRVVEHMKKIGREAFATSHAVKTDDGKNCAVIKVGLKLEDVKFVGDSVVSQQKGEGSEYIVWVIPGCKRFTVQAEPYLPFEYEFPEEADMNTTYRLALDIHDVKVVEHLKELPDDNYAMDNRVNDRNGKPCAVIKVGIKLSDVIFESNLIKKQQKGEGYEYILYVAEGCKAMTIQSNSILPYPYTFPVKITAGKTYGMELYIPNNVESLVRIRTNAKDAKLNLDGQIFSQVRPGLFEIRIPKGEYDYTLTSNLPGFKPATGRLVVNDISLSKRIELATEKRYSLTIQADDKATVTVDGTQLPKLGSQQLDLPAGIHSVMSTLESEGQKWDKTPIDVDMSASNAVVDVTIRGILKIVYPRDAKFEIIPQPGALVPKQKTITTGEPIALLGNYVIKANKKNYLEALARIQVNADDNIDNFKIEVTSKADSYFNGTNGKKIDFKKGFKEYEKMAAKGDEIAQFKAAECLMNGRGVIQNEARAKEYYRQASEAGIADASFSLAEMLLKTDLKEACAYYAKSADQGKSEGAVFAGLYYTDKKDFKSALKYFKIGAADKKNRYQAECYKGIGNLYFNGLGVEKNTYEAKRWFNAAAAKGNIEAKERLIDYTYFGYDGKADKDAAVQAYMDLGNKLSPTSCVRVALHEFDNKNYIKANSYFMRVKDKNVAYPANIGEKFYIMGDKMYNKDKLASFYYYMAAKAHGVEKPRQMFRIGYMYLNGIGTNINHTLARQYFEKGVKMNDFESMHFLASMYETGQGGISNETAAIDLYLQAGRGGYMKAYANLGSLYSRRKDFEKAVFYWELAGNSGSKAAINNLIIYYKNRKNKEKENYWRSKQKK